MKKLPVILYIVAALVLLLGGTSGPNGALAGPLPNQSTSANTTVATAGGQGGKGILTIPAAAFQPDRDGYDYENHGRYLKHLHSPGGGADAGMYTAPVHLPDLATVTKMTFYFYDDMLGTDVSAWLQRTDIAGSVQDMAYVASEFVGGYGSKSDDAIDRALIDNFSYAYWVAWRIPAVALTDYMGCAVVIEYDYPPAIPSTEYLSIPAAAFTPRSSAYLYQNSSRYLEHYSLGSGMYLAPVYLPDGATVSKMTFYFYDSIAMVDVQAWLQRTNLMGSYVDMAAVASDWNGGYGSKSDTSIDYATIDNMIYAYHAVWQLPAAPTGQFRGCGLWSTL